MVDIEISGYIVPDEDAAIYRYFGYKVTSPCDVCKKIKKATGDLNIVIDTCYGGSVDAGREIYSEILRYPGNTNVLVTSIAASMGAVIATAGKHLAMTPVAQLMIHRSSGTVSGNVHDLEKGVQTSYNYDEALAAAFVKKAGITKEQALDIMDKETWLTAEKALEIGLIDEIEGSQDTVGSTKIAAAFGSLLPEEVIRKTRKMLAEQKQSEKEAAEKQHIAEEKLNLYEKEVL